GARRRAPPRDGMDRRAPRPRVDGRQRARATRRAALRARVRTLRCDAVARGDGGDAGRGGDPVAGARGPPPAGDGLRRDRPGRCGVDQRARRVGRARDRHLRALGVHDVRRRAGARGDRTRGARVRAARGDGRVGGGVRARRAGVRAARAGGAAGGGRGAGGRGGPGGGDEGEPDGAGVIYGAQPGLGLQGNILARPCILLLVGTITVRRDLIVTRAFLDRKPRIALEAHVRLSPPAPPELAPARVPLHARVAALGAEPDVRPLHVAPARNSAYSTIARSAATARCALG